MCHLSHALECEATTTTEDSMTQPRKTDIIVSHTMVTDDNEHNETIARFMEFGYPDLDRVLRRIALSSQGLPTLDSMIDASLLVNMLIVYGSKYMAPAQGGSDLLETLDIHVELVSGITDYSQRQLFTELLITFELDDKHVVISGNDLISALAEDVLLSDYTQPGSRYNKSRRGYLEAAAFEAVINRGPA